MIISRYLDKKLDIYENSLRDEKNDLSSIYAFNLGLKFSAIAAIKEQIKTSKNLMLNEEHDHLVMRCDDLMSTIDEIMDELVKGEVK